MRHFDSSEALLRLLRPPRRNHFFYGKRMDVQHFVMEQDYGKLKQWLLNRLTLGKGVLCGLRVSVDGDRVCVDPGVAIDGLGREIIVPVRACIDPLAIDDGCCGEGRANGTGRTAPRTGEDGGPEHPASHPVAAPASQPTASVPRPTDGIFTLWVCYRECLADHEPALVSECGTRDYCAAGTVVETFCVKATPGLPPLQDDPTWCAKLWGKPQPPNAGSAGDLMTGADSGLLGLSAEQVTDIKNALQSRRHLLCELFDGTCDPPDADPCVPLAVIVLRDGKMKVETCLVRPRIYSNTALLDLILCLADKIEECCGKHTTLDLMRVASVDFLNRGFTPGVVVASMQSPLQDTAVAIDRNPNAIRIRFSKPFAQNQHVPTTHVPNDPDYKSHNVQVLPDDPLNNVPFVPGALTIEAPDTIRFDLSAESPYMRPGGGWQKGRYRLFLRGTEHPAQNQQALADLDNKAFDGEPIAPSGGVMSGDSTPGGDFSAFFVIGGGAAADTLRVRGVEFVLRNPDGVELVVGRMESPLSSTSITRRFNSIRVLFSKPFSQAGNHLPTTHGLNDPDFQVHNVQVLTEGRRGVPYVPGSLLLESADTIRFDVIQGSRIIDAEGNWPGGTTKYRLYLRGTEDATHPALADQNGVAFDGEPIAPADGVISGDGGPGGDFSASFTVKIA